MPCALVEDGVKTFPGRTFFSKSGSACMKDTGVYLPPKHLDTTSPINVVLWLHGFYVLSHKHLFYGDDVNVRQRVLGSNKDVVLIAPFLGHGWIDDAGKAQGDYSVKDLGSGKWGESYLNRVLKALARSLDPSSKDPDPIPVKNLVVACHSGGGAGMRNLAGTLGSYRSKLKEWWGFDCLYGANAEPDDATFWFRRMSEKDARPLYIYYGPTTIRQSVKLYLMGRGKATSKGNKADPPGPVINDLHVTIGHYETFAFAGQTVNVGKTIGPLVDDLMTRPVPGAKPPKTPPRPRDGDFVKQAADQLNANFAFIPDVHYTIARAFFEARLRDAAFF